MSGGEKSGFKSGFVALIGRPNAGKSTLVNALLGHKVAITSERPQTTRHRLRAILNTPRMQMILVDTPGIHKPHDALGEELNFSAQKAIEDVDAACMLADASADIGRGDKWVADMLKGCDAPLVAVLTKTDLVDRAKLERQEASIASLADFTEVLSVCAPKGEGLEEFKERVGELLPQGPMWFPPDTDTDQAIEVMVAEFIREKLLYEMREELPYSIGVQADEISFDEEEGLTYVYATVYCERESQKGMVIGRGGSVLKRVGTQARHDLKRLFGTKVFLGLKVKVKKGWRSDASQIRRFGYGEGL